MPEAALMRKLTGIVKNKDDVVAGSIYLWSPLSLASYWGLFHSRIRLAKSLIIE